MTNPAGYNTPNVQKSDGSWELGGTVNYLSTGVVQVDGVTTTPADALVGVTATAGELNTNAGVTGGTVTASKTLVVDANKDLASLRNLTATGLVTTATLTTTGNVVCGDAVGDTFKVHGTAGAGTQAVFVADGSDAGTTQTLANALKACLIAHGFMAAS